MKQEALIERHPPSGTNLALCAQAETDRQAAQQPSTDPALRPCRRPGVSTPSTLSRCPPSVHRSVQAWLQDSPHHSLLPERSEPAHGNPPRDASPERAPSYTDSQDVTSRHRPGDQLPYHGPVYSDVVSRVAGPARSAGSDQEVEQAMQSGHNGALPRWLQGHCS